MGPPKESEESARVNTKLAHCRSPSQRSVLPRGQMGSSFKIRNDGAILSIAYDRVRYSNRPEAWKMHVVLGVATMLGVLGVFESFGLIYQGERVFDFDRNSIQTLMYLKLSIAGHLTVFVSRTRGPFWSRAPAPLT